jgi:acyl carrier protein
MRLVSETAMPATDDDEIIQKMTELFRDVFDDRSIVLQSDTTADDIPGWDSMTQVRLAVEIEHRFNIKIKSAKMEELRSVRGMIALITERSAMAAVR